MFNKRRKLVCVACACAAVAVMAGRGLRCGALPELSVKGDRFSTCTKGKTFKSSLSGNVLEAVKKAGLELRKLFLLEHSGIAINETYLQGFGEED